MMLGNDVAEMTAFVFALFFFLLLFFLEIITIVTIVLGTAEGD